MTIIIIVFVLKFYVTLVIMMIVFNLFEHSISTVSDIDNEDFIVMQIIFVLHFQYRFAHLLLSVILIVFILVVFIVNVNVVKVIDIIIVR